MYISIVRVLVNCLCLIQVVQVQVKTAPRCNTTGFNCFSNDFMFFKWKQKHGKPVLSFLKIVFKCTMSHNCFINICIYTYIYLYLYLYLSIYLYLYLSIYLYTHLHNYSSNFGDNTNQFILTCLIHVGEVCL